jgi:hypothetical protein
MFVVLQLMFLPSASGTMCFSGFLKRGPAKVILRRLKADLSSLFFLLAARCREMKDQRSEWAAGFAGCLQCHEMIRFRMPCILNRLIMLAL